MDANQSKKLFTYSIILLMFTGALCSATQGTLLTSYIDYYKLQSSSQGLMSSMQSAGNLAALLLIGLLVGKLEKTAIVMLSAITIPLVFFLLGTRPPFFLLLAGFLVYGVAFGIQDSLASALMVDLNAEQSGKYMNLLHGVFGLSGLAAPVFYSFLMERGMPWNGVLTLVACVCTVSCVVYIVLRSRAKRQFQGGITLIRKIGLKDIKRFLSERRKALLLCTAFLFGAHQIGISSWIMRFVSVDIGAPAYGALALSMFWAGTAVSRLVSTLIPFARTKKIFLGFLCTSIFITVGVVAKNGLLMVVCCLLAGLSEGPILPLMLDMSCTWERENTSLGSTMLLFALYIGFIIMPVLIGKVAALVSLSAAMMMTVLASILGGVLAAGLIRKDV